MAQIDPKGVLRGALFFLRLATTLNVTPAKAGAYPEISGHRPAFAGMTGLGD